MIITFRRIAHQFLIRHPAIRQATARAIHTVELEREKFYLLTHNRPVELQFTKQLSELYDTCRRNTVNYQETLRFMIGRVDACLVRFRSGLMLDCKSVHRKALEIILKLSDMDFTFSQQQQQQIEWTVDLEKGVITTPQGINFDIESVDLEIFAETFLYDVHFVALNLEGKAVVDLGGFVGDTALYYASRGARVFVLEPNPVNYKFLTKNLELNPQLKDRITAYHQAVGPHGKMRFRVAEGVCGEVLDVSQQSQDEETFTEVDSVTLGDVVKETGLTNLFLLKSDCKGYEVELVKDPAISSFSVVKMEYTESLIKTGGPGSLIAELRKRGFSNFRVFKHNFRTYDLKSHGTIMASK